MPDASPATPPVASPSPGPAADPPAPANPTAGSAGAGDPVPSGSEAAAVPPAGEPAPGADAVPDEPKFARQFAALAKREADAARREKEFADREKKAAALEEKLSKFKQSPHLLLQETGLTMQQLLDAVLNEGKPPTVEEELRAVKETLAKQEEERRAEAARLSAAESRNIVESFNARVTDAVKAGGDKFELVNARGDYALVHAVIEQHFEDTKASGKPVLLTAEQAAEMVENHLTREAERFLVAKKVQAKVGGKKDDSKPAEQTSSEPDGKEQTRERKIVDELRAKKQATKPRITNGVPAAPKTDAPPPKNESKSERIQRILAKVRASAG